MDKTKKLELTKSECVTLYTCLRMAEETRKKEYEFWSDMAEKFPPDSIAAKNMKMYFEMYADMLEIERKLNGGD